MSKHTAVIEWKGSGPDFRAGRYSRVHTWTFDGGLSVQASASPDIVPLPWSNAANVDPEEAFVAAVSGCHLLWFLSIAAKRGFAVEGYRDAAEGVMTKNEAGKLWVSTVTLRPQVTYQGTAPTKEQERALHHEAHEQCFIANSIKTQVSIQ
jgi:organic hydroperoxide reductase OsmC/OhrA